MSHVNVGARVRGNGSRKLTKRFLIDAIATEPFNVSFYTTGAFGRQGTIKCSVRDIGTDVLDVVGPDPHTKRDWYATVEVKNGRVVAS